MGDDTGTKAVKPDAIDLAARPEHMPRADAVRLTARIKKELDAVENGAEKLRDSVAEAHRGAAWAALGYASWSQYVDTEFRMSRRRSYQLIAWDDLNRELMAAGEPPATTERQARRTAQTARHAARESENQVHTSTVADLPERAKAAPEPVKRADNPAPASPRAAAKVPAPTPMRREPPAHSVRTDLESAVEAVIECRPADARQLPDSLWRRFESWVDQARTVRAANGKRPTGGGAKPAAKAAAVACKHPVTRRIGDACVACGATVKR